MAGHEVHTAGNAVPSVDGTELGYVLERLAAVGDPDFDLIVTAFRNLAHRRLSVNDTQVRGVALAGDPDCQDVIGAAALLAARLFNPDTNPSLRALGFDKQEQARQNAKQAVATFTDWRDRAPASNANAALDTPTT